MASLVHFVRWRRLCVISFTSFTFMRFHLLASPSCDFVNWRHLRVISFTGIAFVRFCLLASPSCDFVSKLMMLWYCLCFAVIRVKSVTLAFDCLGGTGEACGNLTVLFAFSATRCVTFWWVTLFCQWSF
jgi:hypothetical protein